jgi:hypothetical protein
VELLQLFNGAIKMKITRCLMALVCLVLASCSPPTVYRLAVSSDGDAMRRELTVVNGEGLEEMLRTIYDEAVTEDEGIRYSGGFDAVPQDVGGSGTWFRLASPAGDIYAYAERFRGDDDLVGQVEARLLATDRLADLLIAWFGSEMGEDARWPGLRGFMDTQMRHDMKNLSLYILELERQGVEAEQWGPAYLARVGQYLIDRGYLGADELVGLMRLFTPLGDESDDLLQRVVARRMGLAEGEDIPASLGFLGLSQMEAGGSWSGFTSSPACAELVRGWGVSESDESLEEGDVYGAVKAVLQSAAGMEFELFGPPDEVHLALDCGSEPISTNGLWDAETGRVTWEGLVRERYGLPLFFYACWAEPDTAYQEAHLGGVLFEGESLAEMVMWYTGLSAEVRGRWDGFIGSLDPAQPIRVQVEASRTAGGEEGADPLARGYDLLLGALPVESD